MTAGETIHVSGLKAAVRDLSKLDADARVEIKTLNLAAAEAIARDAAVRAPRRLGLLADSIKSKATAFSASVTAGGPLVPYAAPIHWGWPRRNIAPQPFMYEALDARRDEVVAAYEKGMQKLADKVQGGAD
jgi:hypothetical protein